MTPPTAARQLHPGRHRAGTAPVRHQHPTALDQALYPDHPARAFYLAMAGVLALSGVLWTPVVSPLAFQVLYPLAIALFLVGMWWLIQPTRVQSPQK